MIKVDNLDRGQLGVLENINELYELFPEKKSLTAQEIKVYIKSKSPTKDTSYTEAIIDSALKQKIGPEITKNLIEGLVEQHHASKSMAISAPIVSNQTRGGWAEATEAVLQEYYELVAMADKPDQLQDCDMSFQEAIEWQANDSGIKWPLDILNKCLGGVAPGLGLVIARSDIGKTSFILNCLAYFAHQLKGTDHQILYLGNEEMVIGLKARLGVALLGVTTEWAEENPIAFGEQVSRKGGDCVRFHGNIRSTRDAEVLIKRYNPIVTVADQIGKFSLPGSKAEGVAHLAEVYGWFRSKSQEYNTMVMAAAQADVKAHNIQWLSDIHINASKTDAPGELDWGVGIGFLIEPGLEYKRFINIFKIKHGRKGRSQVTFDPETCRYKD